MGEIATVFIVGGSGFVGSNLSNFFAGLGYKVTVLGLSGRYDGLPAGTRYIKADARYQGTWMNELSEHDIVVNLAGATIAKRWTKKWKNEIYTSRILTTRNVVNALSGSRCKVLFNASAVGYYGNGGERQLTEDDPPGKDFLSKVCIDWENEALKAEQKGVRVIITRFAVVLGAKGGALRRMAPAFKAGLGGILGSGKQWFPWIHIHDLCRIYQFALEENLNGVVNCCSPYPVRNEAFVKTLARVLGRPCIFRIPAFALKAVFGEMGDSLLVSQKCVPHKLLRSGFKFSWPSLDKALAEIARLC